MPHNIYQTTAEEIITATDAILQKKDGASDEMIADFLASSILNAQHAAGMAVELGLVKLDVDLYFPLFPYANYIVTSSLGQKAASVEKFKIFNLFLKIL